MCATRSPILLSLPPSLYPWFLSRHTAETYGFASRLPLPPCVLYVYSLSTASYVARGDSERIEGREGREGGRDGCEGGNKGRGWPGGGRGGEGSPTSCSVAG